MPPCLTYTILDSWLSAVTAAGDPAKGIGATSADPKIAMDAAQALQLDLPHELATLWTWREFEQPAVAAGVNVCLLRPSEAVRVTELARVWFAEQEAEIPGTAGWGQNDIVWNRDPSWWLSVDATDVGPPSRVYATLDGDFTAPPRQVASSLGELFLHWTTLIRNGHETFSTHWQPSLGRYPEFPADS